MAHHLVLVTDEFSADETIAAWLRVLPEDDVIAYTRIDKQEWKGDIVTTFYSARPEYIDGLEEIIDETIPDTPHLIKVI